jgi:predicted anti-sigma-YlaC factor YlaD
MQVSLDLDDALSQLEVSMVSAHLARCADCRAYADGMTGLTHALRSAPLENLERRVVVRRPRRIVLAQAQVAVAAAVVLALVGLVSQMATSNPEGSRLTSARITDYGSRQQLEYELQLMANAARVAHPPPHGGGAASSSALA